MRLFFHQFNSYQFKSNAQVITYFSIFNYRSVIKISFLMPRAKIVEIFFFNRYEVSLLGSKCIRALKVIFLFVHNMHMNSHVCKASYCRKICQFISRLFHSFELVLRICIGNNTIYIWGQIRKFDILPTSADADA